MIQSAWFAAQRINVMPLFNKLFLCTAFLKVLLEYLELHHHFYQFNCFSHSHLYKRFAYDYNNKHFPSR